MPKQNQDTQYTPATIPYNTWAPRLKELGFKGWSEGIDRIPQLQADLYKIDQQSYLRNK